MNSDIVPYVAAQTTAWLTTIRTAEGPGIGDGDVDSEVETIMSNAEATVLRVAAGVILGLVIITFIKGLNGDGKVQWGKIIVGLLALYVAIFPNESINLVTTVFGSFQS